MNNGDLMIGTGQTANDELLLMYGISVDYPHEKG